MTQTEALKLALELLAVGTFHSPELQAKRTEVIEQGLSALAQPEQGPDYAWPTIEDYENEVGFSVGDAFKMGWSMARTTNDLFVQMVEQS